MGASNDWKKKKRDILLIWRFLAVMVLLTGICSVISEQKKPVVAAEYAQIGGVVPFSCLYHLQETEKTASVYVIEETGKKEDAFRIREKRVLLKEKTKQGYFTSGIGVSGAQTLVSWSSKAPEDGNSVRVRSREALERSGSLIFVNNVSKERQEQRFFGIPEEEVAKLRTERNLGEEWRVYRFLDETKEGASGSLTKLLWICCIFYILWLILKWDIQSYAVSLLEKGKQFYWKEAIEADAVRLLSHMIFWACLLLTLIWLALTCSRLDYGFLADWLPKERILDFHHYRLLYGRWREDTALYLNTFDDKYAQILRENIRAWTGLGWQTAAVLAGSVTVQTEFRVPDPTYSCRD